MTKQCVTCGETKGLDDYEMRGDTGKYRGACRTCMRESQRTRYKSQLSRPPTYGKVCPKCGELVEVGTSYQAYCLRCKNGMSALRRAGNPDDAPQYYQDNRQKALDNFMYRTYGLDVGDYQALLASQNDGCAICGGTETPLDKTGVRRRMPVDHDHLTGKTRGILCHPCNTTLGNMHDDPALLRKAADYLEGWSDNG